VPPEDPGALAAALEGLIDDPAERARWAGRSRDLQGVMYTWERFATDCLGIYGRLKAARQGELPAAA
jgi:glycosyltransferase involved in cell wall biosynthesis